LCQSVALEKIIIILQKFSDSTKLFNIRATHI
jgi:hypothetical protein